MDFRNKFAILADAASIIARGMACAVAYTSTNVAIAGLFGSAVCSYFQRRDSQSPRPAAAQLLNSTAVDVF